MTMTIMRKLMWTMKTMICIVSVNVSVVVARSMSMNLMIILFVEDFSASITYLGLGAHRLTCHVRALKEGAFQRAA